MRIGKYAKRREDQQLILYLLSVLPPFIENQKRRRKLACPWVNPSALHSQKVARKLHG